MDIECEKSGYSIRKSPSSISTSSCKFHLILSTPIPCHYLKSDKLLTTSDKLLNDQVEEEKEEGEVEMEGLREEIMELVRGDGVEEETLRSVIALLSKDQNE